MHKQKAVQAMGQSGHYAHKSVRIFEIQTVLCKLLYFGAVSILH